MNRRWRITSALVLIGLNLLTGVVALHWWLGLDDMPSLWGTVPAGGKFSWEPIIAVLLRLFRLPRSACLLGLGWSTLGF